MAGKLTTAQGTGILLVTANVGSLFEDPENLQKIWLREFYQTVQTQKPHFVAVHCQEVGGKNYEASMAHVDCFVKELLSSDVLREYSRARVYLDENYKSQEHFTALGSFYFIHDSLRNIQQFDFKAKKFRKVVGRETCTETLEHTPSLEKEKFPQDYFPEQMKQPRFTIHLPRFEESYYNRRSHVWTGTSLRQNHPPPPPPPPLTGHSACFLRRLFVTSADLLKALQERQFAARPGF